MSCSWPVLCRRVGFVVLSCAQNASDPQNQSPLSPPHMCCLTLQIMLSPEARNTAWVSFDGRKRQEIRHGDRCVDCGMQRPGQVGLGWM